MTTPATVKAVEETCVICEGAHPYYDCIATDGNISSVYATTGSLPSNTIPNPRADLKAITTPSGVTLVGPSVSPPLSKEVPEVTKDTVQPSTENIQPPVVQTQVPIDDPVVAPKAKPTIPYPSRANKQKLPTTLVNESCSAVILKMFPEKLGDPSKFLIPCEFPKFDECLALTDLGASINLMPLSIWNKLSLPELTSTQMILELADRSTTRPAGIGKDVFCKSRKVPFSNRFCRS
uniref:Reverse transcriptase domain-containing protein n=1 Tax=Tanacetum cinerariifolium TaxID=118510 RepID=A0A6L2M6T0_TANCI|nr:hypothetical protein [Tanacetum cinerariifolium]